MLDAPVDVDVRDVRMSMARKKVRTYIMNKLFLILNASQFTKFKLVFVYNSK